MYILEQNQYKAGDLPPTAYLAWHEWAMVQKKAGIKQKQCGRCGLWKTPQELSVKVDVAMLRDKNGTAVEVVSAICKTCA